MSSSEDKCEVSKDKHEDRRKMEYFCEAINSTKGKKGKSKPPLGGVRLTAAEILSKALEEASIWLKLHNLKTVNPTVHTEMTSWPRVWMKPPARYVKCNVGCSWSAESQIGGGSSLVRDASRMALCHSRRMFSGISSELHAALVNFSWVVEATVNLKSGTDDHGTLHDYDSRFAHSLGDCPRVQYQDSKNMQLSPLL
ncbi:hypothetical protein F2Q69_00036617 [Brassica cretica]|uniref:Uncharacterized protein n=1 Tax=Brassica cretica TaxID=69181 RepID=A0A8S9SBK7_BRACR|nr:hypothetical protein F2Q69_00036617 [Brassica cretica]